MAAHGTRRKTSAAIQGYKRRAERDRERAPALGVVLLNFFSRTLAVLGLLHQARSQRDELLVRGRALGHTPSHACAADAAFITSWLLRDNAGLINATETLRGIVAEDRFPAFMAWSTIYSGWLKIEAGSLEHGCCMINEGLAACDAIGLTLGRYFYLVLLANGQLRLGRIDGGLDTLDRAESLIRTTGARWCEAEVHRLRGDLQLAQSTQCDAEASYQKAIEISRSQDAKLWEIRAATSLGRLWRNQGARNLLAPVYNWFTEGFDAPDLVDAKSLLDQLQ